MTTEIQEYSLTEAAISDLQSRYKGVIYEVQKSEGMNAARLARKELREYRVALEKTRVEIKAPALKRCNLIDSEARRITAVLATMEDPIDEQIKAEEKQREAEESAAREEQRRRDELLDAWTMLKTFVTRYGHLKEYAPIVKAFEGLKKKDAA